MVRKINRKDLSTSEQLKAFKKRIGEIKAQLTSKSLSSEKRQQLKENLRVLIQKLRQ